MHLMTSDREEIGIAITAEDKPGVRPRGALANAGWNVFATIWGFAMSFIIASLLIHTIGAAQYGILLLVWSVTGILGVMNFGFGEATLRYAAYHYGEGNICGVNRVIGSTLLFYLVICIVVFVGFSAAAPVLVTFFSIPASEHRLVAWLLRLAVLLFSLNLISCVYGNIPLALQRYDIGTKITVLQSLLRSGGYIFLVFFKFGLLPLILWDAVVQIGTLYVQAAVIRRISPGTKLMPALSFRGLRETLGFSIFSFLGYAFYVMKRESAKIILGAQLGPSPIAYLGTPENVALRLYLVVASGSESLMPRFSANRDQKTARSLFWNATWFCLVLSLLFLLPLAVLLPDFLRLWISPEFARQSAAVGQLVVLSYIAHAAYAPAATFFRGTGKIWLVTVVTFFVGAATLIFCVTLIPRFGLIGVGYAYLLASLPSLCGLLHGWFYVFGRSSLSGLMRVIGLPLIMAGVASAIESAIRAHFFAQLTWAGLVVLGGLFTVLTGVLVVGADWILGGADAPSKQFLRRVRESNRLASVFRYFRLGRV
jgi:O-antigen/teichoic acid export membrane protein